MNGGQGKQAGRAMAESYLRKNIDVLLEFRRTDPVKYRTLRRYLYCQDIYVREQKAGKDPHEAWQAAADHWNKWANNLLKKRKGLEKSGQWQAEKDRLGILTGQNETTRQWLNEAAIDFSHLALVEHEKRLLGAIDVGEENADGPDVKPILCATLLFASFIFPGKAGFDYAQFYGDALFDHVQFHENAWFWCAQFHGCAGFVRAQFHGRAWFKYSQFHGDTWFEHSQFRGDTWFELTQFHGDTWFRDAQFHGDTWFRDAQFHGRAWFQSTQFHRGAGLRNAQFHGDTWFFDVQFQGPAWFFDAQFQGDTFFQNAQFQGDIWFRGAQLHRRAGFQNTQFKRNACFQDAQFQGNVGFDNAQFQGNAKFHLATFARPVQFVSAHFKGKADFSSIQSKRSFSLHGARFEKVPDFNEASFHEPPVLDDITIKDQLTEMGRLFRSVEQPEENAKTISRNFRKLGKMAHEGRDWLNEMEFFAQEIRTRRFGLDHPFGPNSGRFWFGLFYNKFSNFGRSMARPLLHWLALSLVFFPLLYLLLAEKDSTGWHLLAWLGFVILTMTSIYFWASRERGRTVRAFMRALLSLKWLPRGVIRKLYPLVVPFHLLSWPVVIGWLYAMFFLPAGFWQTFSGKWADALMLSLRQGLVVSGLVRNSHYQNTLESLFGSDLPHDVALALMAQTVLSLVCFFFFFLALRNHFRIR